MPFKGNNIYILAAIAFIVIIVAIIAATNQTPPPPAASPTPAPTNPPINQTPLVTIKSGIGIDRINIYNINTNTRTNCTLMDLPYSFRCTNGDYLQITVHTLDGYEWDGWRFPQTLTFNNHNPLTIQVNGDLELNPHVIFKAGD